MMRISAHAQTRRSMIAQDYAIFAYIYTASCHFPSCLCPPFFFFATPYAFIFALLLLRLCHAPTSAAPVRSRCHVVTVTYIRGVICPTSTPAHCCLPVTTFAEVQMPYACRLTPRPPSPLYIVAFAKDIYFQPDEGRRYKCHPASPASEPRLFDIRATCRHGHVQPRSSTRCLSERRGSRSDAMRMLCYVRDR